ncbi:hypothetical protein CMV_003215 [Castanea mollissima]|uniref:non-specific serine/threonine protein kinase n=1 Tax=Castanea mollissima TaxID=60419 RepID=A0A8J4RHU3_9ROSI|nr:hypothetical protein CMV_003215 [Castanea mollissima]
MRVYAEGSGQDLYVRLAASEIDNVASVGSGSGSDKTKQIIVVVAITVGTVIVLSGLIACFLWKRNILQSIQKGKTEQRGLPERSQDLLLNEAVISSKKEYSGESNLDELELPVYDFGTIAIATDNFSDENKLGQGGFGCVYKGRLVEDEDIAVKRLSKTSGQGIEEFKNELKLIARLQHRNLVRLLGCCIDMDEKILIYEYMENKSLDSILFNKAKCSLLDWPRRFNIICGTARGLLYLHQDSRFRIIHRDMKASNILLDGEMNPKISDFGMARIFSKDQTEANTRRVVGTYGYMSPEYAMDGLFSVKSDVFSFGVLVLEIISGKKNRGFYYANNELNLLGHAWNLWKEGNDMKLGWNLKNGLHMYMRSWLSANDPSVGEFSFSLDPPETPQLVLRKGTQKRNRWGPWDGVRFSGSAALRSNPVFIPMFNSSIEEVYYTFKIADQSLLSRFVVTPDGLIQYLQWRGGDDLYIRMAKEELKAIADAKRDRQVKVIVTSIICSVTGMLLVGIIGWFTCRTRRARRWRRAESLHSSHRDFTEETQEEDLELPLFDLETVSAATDNFSLKNKIGQGGFGPVYKGVLPTGQEIAVKRLSQNSGQGIKEFKNEVIVIAKLQHRNLVKLLGCCIRREERMLIYEYLPNKSLDNFLFDETRKKLTWKMRFDIVMGIARGLLYLHQDSRLRIIHRDLKASNILLDNEMTPKISDFGIARIFGAEQTEQTTKRVMGTYGYMSPEYAMSGNFSVKSDVFSFGVLLLEIISGKKNWGFYHPDHDLNLLGHAWKLWNEGKPLELMDALIDESHSENEVIRCLCDTSHKVLNFGSFLTVVTIYGSLE